MDLKPHQEKIVNNAPDKYGLFLRCRVGKTATAIRLACTRSKSCLVIVPKSLKEQWEEEIIKWNSAPDGKPSVTEFYVITKETFRRDWKKIKEYECVIIDEAHLGFANFKSQLHKSAMGYFRAFRVNFRYILSGTPYTSSAWSIYSLGLLLDKSWKWYDWKTRYFYEIAMGPRRIPVQKKGIEKEISIIINRIGCTLSLSDISEQSEDEYVKEYFDLNKEQTLLIKEFFDPLPIVRFTANHQIESGTKNGDGYIGDKTFDCEKTKRLIELASENRKIAIVACYNLQIKSYRKSLESSGRKTFVINGDTKNKNEIIKEIETCDDCVVLINSKCSAGYSLASIDTMVFASMDFSFVNHVQIKDRIKNLNKNKSCTYIYLLTRSTKDYKSVDQGVYDAVESKMNFDAEIFSH